MRLEELVGKKVVRIKPYNLGNGNMDRSYMSMGEDDYECLEIVDSIPILKITYGGSLFDGKAIIRGMSEYNDDNWADATNARNRIDELKEEHCL